MYTIRARRKRNQELLLEVRANYLQVFLEPCSSRLRSKLRTHLTHCILKPSPPFPVLHPPQHLLRPLARHLHSVVYQTGHIFWELLVRIEFPVDSEDLVEVKALSEAEEALGGDVGVYEGGDVQDGAVLRRDEIFYRRRGQLGG